MDEDSDDAFFGVDQLLQEEGLAAPTAATRLQTWTDELVRKKFQNLSNEQRRYISFQLLGMMKDGKLPWGAQTKIAKEIGVHKSTISRLFKAVEKKIELGVALDVRPKKKGKCGRKYQEVSNEWLESCPLHLRCTYRAYAGFLKCSHMKIFRLLKAGKLRVHTSNNHPLVSDKHKIERMQWVLSHIDYASENSKPKFIPLDNVIHIDEKWFYLNPDKRRFYLLPSEVDPYRVCMSKRYKIKAMFMGVTGRPVVDANGVIIHDGKYGIFPFTYKQRAKKTSKNRVAGTVETKAIQNVTKDVIRDMLIKNIIPSIMEKWPEGRSKIIFIQQDNARPHLQNDDPLFRDAATRRGFNIYLINQPPQSPDFNILDLAIFRAVQSIQYHSFPKDLDDLIQKVVEAYEVYDPNLIRYTWIQLQLVMIEVLKVKGGNNYKLPHIGKARLDRLGLLKENVEVDQELLDEAVGYLNIKCNENNNDMDEGGIQVEVDAE